MGRFVNDRQGDTDASSLGYKEMDSGQSYSSFILEAVGMVGLNSFKINHKEICKISRM